MYICIDVVINCNNITYISETKARNLQSTSPKGHGYCCQYTLRSFGNPKRKRYILLIKKKNNTVKRVFKF